VTYRTEELTRIYEKTRGKCHICHCNLPFSGYGRRWHVDHSRPRALGGSDHMNNLFAACITCNCSKQHGSTRAARATYGKKCAPLPMDKYSSKVAENTVLGGLAGALGGALMLGPAGFWLGLFIGGLAGNGAEVDK
jgi:hypothetical protein